jgi:quercetin dioxygenase-like cupin family protein
MKLQLRNAALVVAAALFPMAISAQAPAHQMYMAKDLKWDESPALPKGVKVAVLEGPMNEAKPFIARIKLPANTKIAPHTHPAIEHVTVISGGFAMGMGEKFEEKGMHTLKPGDVMIMQPKTPHYGMAKGETVVQVHGVGPWAVNYVNEADDPRKQAAAAPKKK